MPEQNHQEREEAETQTRHSLILRLHDWKDRRSWDEFYRTYHRLIYSVARQSGLRESEAWDVVQETLVSIAKQSLRGTYDPSRGSFKAWLLHVTRWRIHDMLRNRKHDSTLSTHDAASAPDSELTENIYEGFESLWEREWQQNITRAAVARVKRKVSPSQFQIFDYHVLQGMDAAEVRSKLGVSATQVYLAKHRVGAQLRREIAELRSQEKQ